MTDLNKVLTVKGYSIKKSWLSGKQLDELKRELTVKPLGNPKFMAATKPFTLYAESPARIYVPRCWGKEKYGDEEADLVPTGNALPPELKFTGTPFDYQEKIIEDFLKVKNGLICVPCGRGKTFMALAIAARLGRRFLICVDKEFLMDQWKGEMERFFPGLRIGIIQTNICQTDLKYDCTICMIQTLLSRDFPPFASYGLTIFDECHHLGAGCFSQVLLKIQTKFMLGLSATPERDDGLTKVFLWFLGNPVYWEKVRDPDPTVKVVPMYFKSDQSSYRDPPTDWKGEVSLVHLLGQIVDHEPRTDWIAKKLIEISANPLRKILVLSERKVLLEALEVLLTRAKVSVGYYIGGMKQEEREKSAKDGQVILGTYAMASEGMNIKELNCVLMASPRKKIEQSIGRILRMRPDERKIEPLILDVVDMHDVYKRQYASRKKFYKDCSYDIEGSKREVKVDENVCTIID